MRIWTRTAGCLGLALLVLPLSAGAGPSPAARKAKKIAAVVLTPSGATLHPGESVNFIAEARNRRGDALPDVSFRWRSTNSAVAAVDENGVTTAAAEGTATITARTGKRKGSAQVAVVSTPPGGGSYVAAGIGGVVHLLADDEWVYWTEASKKQVRLRKTGKSGGAIYDLASEPARDSRGLEVSYAHLRQIGDRLYWTRRTVGFYDHWSILSVAKEGGDVETVLAEDVSVEPTLPNLWTTSGQHVVVVVENPAQIGLPAATQVAAFDTESRSWSSLVSNLFVIQRTYLLAADDQNVFIRGLTEDGSSTVILRTSPTARNNDYQTLLSRSGEDAAIADTGASDGSRLYYWSKRGDSHVLQSLPVTGGAPETLLTGSFGTGLVTDGASLYWARGGNTAVRMPVTGGQVTTLQEGVFAPSTLGGLALDAGSLFLARKDAPRSWSIVRIDG